jgi:tetratricopeptide (TPR) repeat protein
VELHRTPLLVALAVLVLAVAGIYLWRHSREQREAHANAALLELHARPVGPGEAVKASDFLKVAEEHASTSAAVRARLLAAGTFFTEGRYSESLAEFEKILAKEGSGTLAAQAAYGVAASLDALGRLDEAIAKYQQVISSFPGESVAGQARLALAQIHESRDQPESALRFYDELLGARADGPFSQTARQRRAALLERHAELAGTNAAAVLAD